MTIYRIKLLHVYYKAQRVHAYGKRTECMFITKKEERVHVHDKIRSQNACLLQSKNRVHVYDGKKRK
jgi:hypothetical protein